MTKDYTDKQQKFLEVLFTEANGDLRTAATIAGYSPNTRLGDVTAAIADEIVEKTKQYLALNAPKAAVEVVNILKDPTALGNKDKLAAARDLLDRIGLKATEKVEVSAKNPLFILPAKED